MNKKAISKAAIIVIVVVIILIILAIYIGSRRAGLSPREQCRDGVDNDGDSKIDYPSDSGCTNKFDNSEASCVPGSTTCGIGECRRTSTCINDAVSCTPGTPIAEICGDGKDNNCDGVIDNGCNPDSCSDTDGGIVKKVQGTVSGYKNNQAYSNTDFCLSGTSLTEYYCGGTNAYNTTQTCLANESSTCVNGACT